MTICFERTDEIAWITLNRPEALNAMTPHMYDEIDSAMREIDSDSSVRIGIVRGAGDRAFSAGADLKEMHGDASPRFGWGPWRPESWAFGRTTRKPLIAAIDGYALAGGLELALACDLRIATPSSQFGAPEVKWSILHGLGAARLPSVIGLSNALWMLMTADFIDAQEAQRIGLVNSIVDRDVLDETAEKVALRIVANGADAVEMSKEIAVTAAAAGETNALRLYQSYFASLEGSEQQRVATARFTDDRRPASGAGTGAV